MPKSTEYPDQSPRVFREHYEQQGIVVDLEKIWEFATKTLADEPTSQESSKSAAAFLIELIQAAKYGEKWEGYKRRLGVKKITQKSFDPALVTIDHPAMGLVMAYLGGEIAYDETIVLFNQHIHPASDRQIERWIKDIRPRAEELLKFQKLILQVHDKK